MHGMIRANEEEAQGLLFKRALPLAEEVRPTTWEEFLGVEAIDGSLLQQLRKGSGRPPSIVLWGPPGSGKTTLAHLIGRSYRTVFVPFSAVLGGVKEVREIVQAAEKRIEPTILFIDEIHRFSKAQQDAFLPHIERGTISLIGATTENPSFCLTQALLSRVRVLVLPRLDEEALSQLVHRVLDRKRFRMRHELIKALSVAVGGDARQLLNIIEALIAASPAGSNEIGRVEVEAALAGRRMPTYDREGEEHYNIVSAFIKSLRGSDPDAALYWGFRMIEGGEDPRFVLRRMIIFASEDIGNADPRALQLAVAAAQAFEQLGLPEGRIPIAQAVTYLATAPKSNRSYLAMGRALRFVAEHPHAPVPPHLRNAPTRLMQEMGYGEGYRSPHDCPEGFAPGVQYFPQGVEPALFYEPKQQGYERSLFERQQLRFPDRIGGHRDLKRDVEPQE